MVGDDEHRRGDLSQNCANNRQQVPPMNGLFGTIDRVVDVRVLVFGLAMNPSILKIDSSVSHMTKIKQPPHI